MDELVNKLQQQLDQAIKLADKVHKQKSYLVDLLIKLVRQLMMAVILYNRTKKKKSVMTTDCRPDSPHQSQSK